MRLQKFACFLFLLVLSLGVYAEDLNCQYQIDKNITEEVIGIRLKDTNEFVAGPELITDKFVATAGGASVEFSIINNYDFPIDANISFSVGYNCLGNYEQKRFEKTISVPARDFIRFGDTGHEGYCRDASVLMDTIKFKIFENSYYFPQKKETIEKTILECKGKNDGDICSTNLECGGGYCLKGRCNSQNACYQNDCLCDPATEVQCQDNTKCVKKKTIETASKPICSFEECITKYIDPKTGLCAESPETIATKQKVEAEKKAAEAKQAELQEQERQLLLAEKKANDDKFFLYSIIGILLAGTIVIGFFVLKILRNKKEQEKEITKQLKLRIALASKKIEIIKTEVLQAKKQKETLEKKLMELESLERDLKNTKSGLKKKQEELRQIEDEIQDKKNKHNELEANLFKKKEALQKEMAKVDRLCEELREEATKPNNNKWDFTNLVMYSKERTRKKNLYMLSREWDEKRRQKLKEADYKCQDCSISGKSLDVHHLTYDNLGHELMSDLIALCRKCHLKRESKKEE